MFTGKIHSRARRRGIVLVVILAMLALLALIGITFATFSNQAKVNATNFSTAKNFPDSSELMDFALLQLIADTSDPRSVIRGHSLMRDMYGNDAKNNGSLSAFPDGSSLISFTQATVQANGTILATTNIPVGAPAFYQYGPLHFNRWLVKFPSSTATVNNVNTFLVAQSFEILLDDTSGAFRVFTLAPSGEVATNPTQITGYTTPDIPGIVQSTLVGNAASPNPIPTNIPVILDGRFLHAFNGPGLGSLGIDGEGHPLTEYGNFRYNGAALTVAMAGSGNWAAVTPAYGDPNQVPSMDEDYDACDLENWFLAIQSADGQVVIPSFHRPGILSPQDWHPTLPVNVANPAAGGYGTDSLAITRAYGKLLRPRAADGHSPISFPDLRPDPTTGKITYDVDNDGDGVTDAVWLDLGYPAKTNSQGKTYKPLFAFTVIGLNGKLPLNTGGNLDNLVGRSSAPNNTHASHLGNSPSEVDLTYALQNAYDPKYGYLYYANQFGPGTPYGNPLGYFPGTNIAQTKSQNNPWMQVDNSGDPTVPTPSIDVRDIQLRNLLCGTRLPTPGYDPNTGTIPPAITNGDLNWVMVNGQMVPLPNGRYDASDFVLPGNNFVKASTSTVSGRWGEPGGIPSALPPAVSPPALTPLPGPYNNPVRAGASFMNGVDQIGAVRPIPGQYDVRDDNYNTNDLFNGELADYFDASGSNVLPVERIRRFVTPFDLTGDGRIITYAGAQRAEFGADEFGRVGFLHYFRPPGMPLNTGIFGLAPPSQLPLSANPPAIPDVTTNPWRGYESFRNPNALSSLTFKIPSLQLGGMPANLDATGATVPVYPGGAKVPTFTAGISSDPGYSSTSLPASTVPSDSPGMNEADEMNLYDQSRQVDEPFGPSDLEWLYRAQDIDGASLNSRLAQLAPISFLNPRDGNRRRHLFALDAWETTNFVWANDNPVATTNTLTNGNYVYSSYLPYAGNTSYAPGVDASFQNFNLNVAYPTPSLAHRDRKINLNFPLPVSNSPIEPVRQKWIRETYTLLKAILPPKAVDTPEELAQLSQYVVNIIDYRDPDCTNTKFVNTDIVVCYPDPANPGKFTLTAPNNYTPSILAFASSCTVATGITLQPYVAYDPTILPPTTATAATSPDNNHFLIQFGMENPPVAINEVLAARWYTKNVAVNAQNTPNAQNYVTALDFELVNTLTKDSLNTNTSDLDLAGWDVVVMPDDGFGRPDPYTGQIPNVVNNLTNVHVYSLATGVQIPPTGIVVPPGGPGPPGLTTRIPALLAKDTFGDGWNSATGLSTGGNGNFYYVFGNQVPPKAQAGDPTYQGTGSYPTPSAVPSLPPLNQTIDMTGEITGKENQYFWLYIRRPPNPFDANFDPKNPNANRVVVDSFRFPYMSSNGTGWTDNSKNPPVDQVDQAPTEAAMFSLERMQPLRGGHAVPPLTGTNNQNTPYLVTAYGYSEQTSVPISLALQANPAIPPLYGNYGSPGTAALTQTTKEIANSLGKPNSWNNNTKYQYKEEWDYVQFNDRDFTSVAELLMVPSTAPGLFTKQFGEMPPPLHGSPSQLLRMDNPMWTTGSPLSITGIPQKFVVTQWNTVGPWNDGQPTPNVYGVTPVPFNAAGVCHAFPYLNDEFYYSASTEFKDSTGVIWPTPTTGPYPYLSQDPSPLVNGRFVGGPSGAGWHKMLEFFEVPSTMFGAIGSVAQGSNYDWLRQDTKPGQLNLNLIIDEEVFLGLMGEYFYSKMNKTQLAPAQTPAIVTEVEPITGAPTGYYTMDDSDKSAVALAGKGYLDKYTDPDPRNSTFTQTLWGNNMKAAFSDFLKLRHGGSGFLFAYGRGTTGQDGQRDVNGNYTPVAAERPFRSLSYPDINYTVMRPAAPPPSPYTAGITLLGVNPTVWSVNPTGVNPVAWFIPPIPATFTLPAFVAPALAQWFPVPPWAVANTVWPAWAWPLPPATPMVWDPGLKNPFLFTMNNPQQPMAIPPRRLFEISDWYGTKTGQFPPCNASSGPNVLQLAANVGITGGTGDPNVNNMVALKNLAQPNIDLTSPLVAWTDSIGILQPFSQTLGSALNDTGSITVGTTTIPDQRDHPCFRTEWMQRVMNLTTVRTHQYAVWITIGFFEVTKQGDPLLATTNPAGAYDILGLELGSLDGTNVRYRSFFLVDRTKAVGFNPALPGDFRSMVVYRQRIE
jgi:large repetitive protein